MRTSIVLHDAGSPTLGVPRERNVWERTFFFCVNTSQDFIFSFQSFFRFPANFHMTFRCALKIVAGALYA